jgi:uncharacterized SAM-binding protein YcdF (DUF218 family)
MFVRSRESENAGGRGLLRRNEQRHHAPFGGLTTTEFRTMKGWGERGNGGEPTESAARRYALRGGVPAADILIEEESRNTYKNR